MIAPCACGCIREIADADSMSATLRTFGTLPRIGDMLFLTKMGEGGNHTSIHGGGKVGYVDWKCMSGKTPQAFW